MRRRNKLANSTHMPLHRCHGENAPYPFYLSHEVSRTYEDFTHPQSLDSLYQTPSPRTNKRQAQMSDPRRPTTNPFGEPPPDPTRRNTHARRQRRNRRQYALPRFDFEYDRLDPLVTYGVAETPQSNVGQDSRTQRAQRYYSTQILTSSTPVSPCLNATDRARRARRSRIRQPGDVDPNAEEVFCDTTPLIREYSTQSVAKKRQRDVETDDDDEIQEMVLNGDEEEMDGNYEFIDSVKGESMDNGTARRWHGGFRR